MRGSGAPAGETAVVAPAPSAGSWRWALSGPWLLPTVTLSVTHELLCLARLEENDWSFFHCFLILLVDSCFSPWGVFRAGPWARHSYSVGIF